MLAYVGYRYYSNSNISTKRYCTGACTTTGSIVVKIRGGIQRHTIPLSPLGVDHSASRSTTVHS